MSRPLLTRFAHRVLKDKDATKVQIPAASASLGFYFQGATASNAATIPSLDSSCCR